MLWVLQSDPGSKRAVAKTEQLWMQQLRMQTTHWCDAEEWNPQENGIGRDNKERCYRICKPSRQISNQLLSFYTFSKRLWFPRISAALIEEVTADLLRPWATAHPVEQDLEPLVQDVVPVVEMYKGDNVFTKCKVKAGGGSDLRRDSDSENGAEQQHSRLTSSQKGT